MCFFVYIVSTTKSNKIYDVYCISFAVVVIFSINFNLTKLTLPYFQMFDFDEFYTYFCW